MRKIITAVSLSLSMLLLVAPAALAFDPFAGICSGTEGNNSSLCQGRSQADPTTNPLIGPHGLIVGIANIIAIVAGLAAVIIVVVAGFKLVTSGGDPAKIKSARDTIIGALVGVVIIVLADAIIGFVIGHI